MSAAAPCDLWLGERLIAHLRTDYALATLRDTLLSKLLSGELSIAGASASVKVSA